MSVSLGLAFNAYNDANALPGLLENATSYFDDIVCLHAGPQGAYSSDGTIEILEKWGIRVHYGSIDEGFGVVRTKAVRLSTCEWAMILDCDERFHVRAPVLECDDNLFVQEIAEPYNQGAWVKSLIQRADIDGVRTIRRHWHDFTWKRPTQNWKRLPDWQLRIVRNVEHIFYTSKPTMHERIIDNHTGGEPRYQPANFAHGPFHDHFHCHYKPMEAAQRLHDIAVYDALHFGHTPPTEEEFRVILAEKERVAVSA